MKLLEGLPEAKSLTAKMERQFAISDKNQLVLGAMREGFAYAKQCCRASLPDDDIYSLTYAALQSATKNYDAAKGRFFAYAKVFIRGNICREWRSKDVVKHSSLHQDDEQQHYPFPSTHFPDDYEDLLSDGDENIPWQGGSVEPEFDLIATRERWKIIQPIIEAKLNKREQLVIELKYNTGFGFPKIGELLGISRQAVESVHSRALRKVRNELMRQKKFFNQ